MKRKHIKTIIGTVLMTLFLMACSDILEETPRSNYTPEYFKTEAGVNGGLTALYAHLRLIYGQNGFYSHSLSGTDEATWGSSGGTGLFKNMDLSGVGEISADASDASGLWNAAFPYINTASGIIENAAAVGISEALISEARFFRAFDYFLLVQSFGGVPLDLGAGELKFNTSTSRFSVRNTVPEVYTKCIFPDLLTAIENLPEAGRVTGAVTKTAARLFLAKAYLTYAWWLENPNNIPTYPETARTDPDGYDAAWYFQAAYDVAITAIENPGDFGLQSTFYEVNEGSNDRNNEIILYADHTETDEYYNGGSLTYAAGDMDNTAGWMMNWSYQSTKSATDLARTTYMNPIRREAEQHLGRPWVRMAPPHGVFKNTFADKTNDSRYDGTFTTVYRANWSKAGDATTLVYNANDMVVYTSEPILTFLNEEPATAIDYANTTYCGIGAGSLAGRSDYVIGPNAISRIVFPGLWKLGPYRTDNGTGLGSPNAGSTRPYNIAKFSELYFIAAEAAVKGATGSYSALDLINVIRARAGKWSWDNNGNIARNEDNSAAMIAATPATITIDYILAERSREYFGEGYRWFDLVRTQKWAEIAGSYQICGTGYNDHTVLTVTRTIEDYHYLRPIPKGQLDGMEMTDDERYNYQNPVYRDL
jgi:starch-binding outer membrane protein, SusD/RagB family